MKIPIQILSILCLLVLSCKEEPIAKDCTTPATVKDLTGLDGCGYVFELTDGTYLLPVWDWGWCGTPPLPEGATDDPLNDFQYVDGKKVWIAFEERTDVATACMAGKPVKITCLKEIDLQIID